MKLNRLSIIAIIFCSLLVSCARRSRNVRYRNASNPTEVSNTDSRGEFLPKVEAQKNRGSKLDGPNIFRKYDTAVFMVFTTNGEEEYQGSGFFINDHGLAVSNYHVFKDTYVGYEQIKLEGSDKVYKVKRIIAKSEEHDFILFEVNCDGNNYINIADQRPRVGEKVYAIGSPRGLENTFSSGEISQWRSEYVMQTNVLIDHGSSGGPLINEYGLVVGITSGTFADGSQANLNYAWSIDVIKDYIE